MLKNWNKILLLGSLILLFTSCMHKDVMTDRADDISSSIISTRAKRATILLIKKLFSRQVLNLQAEALPKYLATTTIEFHHMIWLQGNLSLE